MEPNKLPREEMAQGLPGELSTGMGPALCQEQDSRTSSPSGTHAVGPRAMPGMEPVLPGREGTERANSNCVPGGLPAHCLESLRQGALLVQKEIGHHEGQSCRDPEISHEADEEGHDDANGDGTLGVLGFLPCVNTRGSIGPRSTAQPQGTSRSGAVRSSVGLTSSRQGLPERGGLNADPRVCVHCEQPRGTMLLPALRDQRRSGRGGRWAAGGGRHRQGLRQNRLYQPPTEQIPGRTGGLRSPRGSVGPAELTQSQKMLHGAGK